LLLARRHGYPTPDSALDESLAWLNKPEDWHRGQGAEKYGDRLMATVQFTATLADVSDRQRVETQQARAMAAACLIELQNADGSWPVEARGTIGSPVTYGAMLATYMSGNALQSYDADGYRGAIEKAATWLRRAPAESTLDAATVLLARGLTGEHMGSARVREARAALMEGQAESGGWGPFVRSSPEVFDTAIVLLALSTLPEEPAIDKAIKRGRAYLVKTQELDGSWPETTRPSGGASYAQRISTTAWAVKAILKIDSRK
jgi:squalene cyclase